MAPAKRAQSLAPRIRESLEPLSSDGTSRKSSCQIFGSVLDCAEVMLAHHPRHDREKNT